MFDKQAVALRDILLNCFDNPEKELVNRCWRDSDGQEATARMKLLVAIACDLMHVWNHWLLIEQDRDGQHVQSWIVKGRTEQEARSKFERGWLGTIELICEEIYPCT
ncbi:MAG: hypothetical protein JO261_11510 [Alphaproteobacteria bacterium]|nr:hypothetical protein [Alphaproteobacteria bacterium]